MIDDAVDDVLLTLETWGSRFEFRPAGEEGGQVSVTAVDRDGSSSNFGIFPSVLAGLGEVGAEKLEWGNTVEVAVSPSVDVEVEAIVEAMRSANPDFAPTGAKGDVVYDPPITVNGRRFFGVEFDDGSWEFVENADEYSTIAYVQLFESASRTSGYFTETVGRLPGGEVLELSEPDEDDGYARARRTTMTDVDAVRRWLEGSEWWVQPFFVAAYRDGVSIEVGSDFDPDWSDTLEIGHMLALTDAEREELWRLLGVDPSLG